MNDKIREQALLDIIEYFPECNRVKTSDVADGIIKVFNEASEYQCLHKNMNVVWQKYFPVPTREQWSAVDGTDDDKYCREFIDYESEIFKWMKIVNDRYVAVNGTRRTYDEACEIAAGEWMKKLFNFGMQDNGDHSGHSDNIVMLGSMLKHSAQERVADETKENIRKEFVKYYKNHCIYTHNDGFKYYCAPSCDYDPNGPLYTILKNGGVEDKNIRSLCPWKTSISIDEKDNAVVVRGCKKEQYI